MQSVFHDIDIDYSCSDPYLLDDRMLQFEFLVHGTKLTILLDKLQKTLSQLSHKHSALIIAYVILRTC